MNGDEYNMETRDTLGDQWLTSDDEIIETKNSLKSQASHYQK